MTFRPISSQRLWGPPAPRTIPASAARRACPDPKGRRTTKTTPIHRVRREIPKRRVRRAGTDRRTARHRASRHMRPESTWTSSCGARRPRGNGVLGGHGGDPEVGAHRRRQRRPCAERRYRHLPTFGDSVAVLALSWDVGLRARALLHSNVILELNYRNVRSSDYETSASQVFEADVKSWYASASK